MIDNLKRDSEKARSLLRQLTPQLEAQKASVGQPLALPSGLRDKIQTLQTDMAASGGVGKFVQEKHEQTRGLRRGLDECMAEGKVALDAQPELDKRMVQLLGKGAWKSVGENAEYQELQKTRSAMMEKLRLASNGDAKTTQRIADGEQDFKTLDKPLAAIEAELGVGGGGASVAGGGSGELLASMGRSVDEVEALLTARTELLQKMQDMLRADGAAQWLYDKVEQDKLQENDAIQEFLSAVQPLDDTYKANQDKLTATLSQLQGREGELKGKTILSYDAAQRQELLQQVVEAHETYRKVLEAVREGQNFYISMYDPVKNHQLRCQDFKTARELMAQDAEDEKRRKAEEEAAATAAAAKAKAASDQLEADARKRLAEERAREEADMALARRLADSGAMSVVRQPRVPPPQPDAVQVPPAAAQDQLATDAAIAQAMGGGAGTRHRPPPLHPRPPPPDTSADEALARALAAEGGTPTAASAPAVADKCLNCDRPPARGYQHCCRGCALRTGCECGDADLARQLASMASPTAASLVKICSRYTYSEVRATKNTEKTIRAAKTVNVI